MSAAEDYAYDQTLVEDALWTWFQQQVGDSCPVIWEGRGAKPVSTPWAHLLLIAGPTRQGHTEGSRIDGAGHQIVREVAQVTLSTHIRGASAGTLMHRVRTSLARQTVLSVLRQTYSLTPRTVSGPTTMLQPRETDVEQVVQCDFIFGLEAVFNTEPGFISSMQAELAIGGSSVPVEAP